MMKASNNKNLLQSCGFYTFYLTYKKENPNKPNILNAKVHEYMWKISEYICQKNHEKPKYDIL